MNREHTQVAHTGSLISPLMASPLQSSPEPLSLPLPLPPPPSPPQNPLLPSPGNPTSPSPPPLPDNTILPSPPSDHDPTQSPSNNHLRLPSPPFSPSRLAIVLRSPDKPTSSPDPNPNPNPYANSALAAVTIGSLLATADLTVAKASAANGGGSVKRGLLAPNPWKFRRNELRRLELGLRVSALVLCLVSFSLMAADTVPGWAGDSFIRYQEYRYLLSVNVIGFMYSAFQFTSEVHQLFTRKHFISRPIGFCFNLAMDQILAYMLVSAASAATSQNYIWMSRFGGDNFTKLINVSVAMSFLAFSCLAFSSVLSAHYLFNSVS